MTELIPLSNTLEEPCLDHFMSRFNASFKNLAALIQRAERLEELEAENAALKALIQRVKDKCDMFYSALPYDLRPDKIQQAALIEGERNTFYAVLRVIAEHRHYLDPQEQRVLDEHRGDLYACPRDADQCHIDAVQQLRDENATLKAERDEALAQVEYEQGRNWNNVHLADAENAALKAHVEDLEAKNAELDHLCFGRQRQVVDDMEGE